MEEFYYAEKEFKGMKPRMEKVYSDALRLLNEITRATRAKNYKYKPHDLISAKKYQFCLLVEQLRG